MVIALEQEVSVECWGNVLQPSSVGTARLSPVAATPPVPLTPTELRLLRFLRQHAGQAIARETLLTRIWGYSGSAGAGQVVDVYIRRLRQKLETPASAPPVIEFIVGQGYRWVGSADPSAEAYGWR